MKRLFVFIVIIYILTIGVSAYSQTNKPTIEE